MITDIKDIDVEAMKVENCGDVYFVPAFSGLFAPYWNQEARGIICGISEDTQKGHWIRAALESVCYQVRDILDAMKQDCGIPLSRLQVDGGMTASNLLMQLQSDLIGMDVMRPKMAETTALGAAMVAGRAVGVWDIEKVEIPMEATIFSPKITDNERDVRYSKWKMAVERSFGWDKVEIKKDNTPFSS